MATVTLTVRYLDSLHSHGKRFEVFDALVPGLAVRVSTSGRKSFTLYYRHQGTHAAPRPRALPGRPPGKGAEDRDAASRAHLRRRRSRRRQRRVADRLLNKWAVERETSLDITTIYRRMKAGTFPQPVRVGKRRVAWRESDIAAWQASLEMGTR